MNARHPSPDLQHAISLLQIGDCVAIPTETVYGLAANALNPSAVAKIFLIKNRPTFDPLIVHVHDLSRLNDITADFPPAAKRLAEKFWPGPLTLILPKRPTVPDLVTSGLPTVAVRIPSHPLTQELLRSLPFPLAAPSANRFGRISPTSAQAVLEELGNSVPLILDGGSCSIGLESTIVSVLDGSPKLLRAGGIPLEAIESVVGTVALSNTPLSTPQAPGQLLHHYAPSKPLTLVTSLEEAERISSPDKGLLAWGTLPSLSYRPILNLSPREDEAEAAANFFSMLRALDSSSATSLVALRLPERGLGRAINERLHRAAS